MTTLPPDNIQKKFSSLAWYVQKTRDQLLPILVYIEKLKRDGLQYQLIVSTGLYQAKVKSILTEMKGWSPEIRTRTRGAYDTFNEEKKILGDNFPESLRRILGDIAFLFSRLLESNSELSLTYLEQQIERLQKEPTSKEAINGMKEALENIHHVFIRLLDAVHTEEKDLAEEEKMLDQISGNMVVEQNKDQIFATVKKVFDIALDTYPDLKYGTLTKIQTTAKTRREIIDHQQTLFLTVTITVDGLIGLHIWDGHLRYDAKGRFFEAVLGERKGFQYTPEEHHSYTSTTEMLREFPTEFIQYILNKEIMKKKN